MSSLTTDFTFLFCYCVLMHCCVLCANVDITNRDVAGCAEAAAVADMSRDNVIVLLIAVVRLTRLPVHTCSCFFFCSLSPVTLHIQVHSRHWRLYKLKWLIDFCVCY